MGNNLFGANISGKLAKALGRKRKLLPGTLRRETEGARTSSSLSSGRTKVVTTHTFRGYEAGMEALQKGTIMPDARSAVFLLGDTVRPVTEPMVNDTILLSGSTFTVVSVSHDPDKAGFTLQVK